MKPAEETIFAIVGLGLMGGSLALALRSKQACKAILAVTPSDKTRAQALTQRVVDEASAELSLAAQADVIVLATPVRTILRQLAEIGKIAREGAIVIDLGSTKQKITEAMETLPPHVQPIGAHPMCGKETFGFSASDRHLYRNAPFILTPLQRTSPDTVAFAESLARTLEARPILLDPVRHDKIVATISHLPFALALTLMTCAMEASSEEDLLFALAAGGMRDTSRLAASDTTMMLDILMTNRENVTGLLRAAARHLDKVAAMLEREEETKLKAHLESAAQARRSLHV